MLGAITLLTVFLYGFGQGLHGTMDHQIDVTIVSHPFTGSMSVIFTYYEHRRCDAVILSPPVWCRTTEDADVIYRARSRLSPRIWRPRFKIFAAAEKNASVKRCNKYPTLSAGSNVLWRSTDGKDYNTAALPTHRHNEHNLS